MNSFRLCKTNGCNVPAVADGAHCQQHRPTPPERPRSKATGWRPKRCPECGVPLLLGTTGNESELLLICSNNTCGFIGEVVKAKAGGR